MSTPQAVTSQANEEQFVTMRIQGQLLGIPVHDVREILNGQKITKIPLVPPQVAGTLNLRGRIVTVIDICHRLDLPLRSSMTKSIFIVVEHKGELYSLVVDSVHDVLTIDRTTRQALPPNLSANWREVSSYVYRLEKELMVILDPKSLFNFQDAA